MLIRPSQKFEIGSPGSSIFEFPKRSESELLAKGGNSTTKPTDHGFVERQNSFKNVFKLRSVARKVIVADVNENGGKSSAVARCGHYLAIIGKDESGELQKAHHVEVRQGENSEFCHTAHVTTCQSTWNCPVCARKIAAAHMKTQTALATAHARQGRKIVALRLSLPHRYDDKLQTLLSDLKSYRYKTTQGAPWKKWAEEVGYFGRVCSTEIRWNPLSGWHPHFHFLFYVSGYVSDEKLDEFKDWMIERFCRFARAKYPKTTPDAQWGKVLTDADFSSHLAAYTSKGNMVSETVAGHGKESFKSISLSPFQLLEKISKGGSPDKIQKMKEAYLEYVRCSKGKQLVTTPDLLSMYGLTENDDEEGTEEQPEPDESKLKGTLTEPELQALNHTNLMGELLVSASHLPWIECVPIIEKAVIKNQRQQEIWKREQEKSFGISDRIRKLAREHGLNPYALAAGRVSIPDKQKISNSEKARLYCKFKARGASDQEAHQRAYGSTSPYH